MVRQRKILIRKLLSTLPAGLAEVQRAFESVDVINPQQQPTHIFMTGDSLLRQVFISVACNAYSLNAVEYRIPMEGGVALSGETYHKMCFHRRTT